MGVRSGKKWFQSPAVVSSCATLVTPIGSVLSSLRERGAFN